MSETAKYLSKQELKRFFASIKSPRDRAIFHLSYFRGLRASEVGRLPMSALKLREKRLFIRRLKGSAAAEFLLSDNEVRYLKAYLAERGTSPGPIFLSRRGLGISRQQLDLLIKKYCAEAGIDRAKAHMHVLKHSIATHLLQSGVHLLHVQRLLGHKKLSSTEYYLHLTDNEVDEVAAQFYAGW